jgi:hypothetical protein
MSVLCQHTVHEGKNRWIIFNNQDNHEGSK